MADVGTVLSVVDTLFTALDSPFLQELCSKFRYRSKLDNLRNTVSAARAVLLDAQAMQHHELSHQARDYIHKLKLAVYDADDLLDKFNTLAAQKKHLVGCKLFIEVRAFFSHLNYSMSSAITEIRRTLDAITLDHVRFDIDLGHSEPIRRRNRETCSYVCGQNIIGRDVDKKVVIDKLLDHDVEADVSFVKVVGIGGLGKTALAQLVYNDKVIQSTFPMRMWVCVSDQDPNHLDIMAVLLKILEVATKMKPESSVLELVQENVRKALEGKKYLLVLDDVWIEDRDQCLRLGEFLTVGARGSRILVTTRSHTTANVIGSGRTHVLQGLSEEDSWSLFEMLAFEKGQADRDTDLVDIGKQIVKKCPKVPLAIRTAGSLLCGKPKEGWRAFQKMELAKSMQNDDATKNVLKVSYYNLDTHLKSCFSYCAVFPKDYVMDKMELISLWMAQGYLETLDERRSLNDVGEECFSILLARCFFQDVGTDEYGEIVSCKMHDMMHDLAVEVAGKEICNAYSVTRNTDEAVRHVFSVGQECVKSSFPRTKIRTYVKDGFSRQPVNALLKNWKYLRALHLRDSGIKKLPCEIGGLLHLRYLDLSRNDLLKRLPAKITKLYNLQTLLLKYCCKLKELPSHLSKLAKLRVLDIEGCSALRYMPCGLDKLTSLYILPLFVVGELKSSKQEVGRLQDISALELKGKLEIIFRSNEKRDVKGMDKEGFLKRKEYISEIVLLGGDKAVTEEVQPSQNLKRLCMEGYRDVEKPSWAIDDKLQTSLPNLVELVFFCCKVLEDLPMLGRFRFLKNVKVHYLVKLEYMEKGSSSSYGGDEAISGIGLFPALEELSLWDLPKLKGWWKGDDDDDDDDRSMMPVSFPHLSQLRIMNCPMLTSVPLCPKVKTLVLRGFNEKIKIMEKKGDGQVMDMASFGKLRYVETDDVGYLLKSLPVPAAFQSLSWMSILGDKKVENLREVEDVFRSCSSSLQSLYISECRKVRSMSGALEHLTTLQTLRLIIHEDIMKDEMKRRRIEEEDDIPWTALQHSLHYLDINYMPRGLRHLTSLQTLDLNGRHIEMIPEWFTSLSSLKHLEISHSSRELKERCKSPDGADWPKIQHIHTVEFLPSDDDKDKKGCHVRCL